MTLDAPTAIWEAVHRITQPTRRHIPRELTEELEAARLAAEARAAALAGAAAAANLKTTPPPEQYVTRPVAGMTAASVLTPSLWDQAQEALTTGREQAQASGRSPLATRCPVDVDLLEITALIRETVAHQLHERRIPLPASVPDQINRLASLVITEGLELWWWEYRFASWGRLITTYLNSAEHQPKPTRLRNAPCPLCHTRQVTIEGEDGPIVVPPIVVAYLNGYVRAAECTACGAAWWRDELHHLADLINTPTQVVAETA